MNITMHPVLYLVFISLLYSSARALTSEEICNSKLRIHTPFQPWPTEFLYATDFDVTPHVACWFYADCIFSQATETRKQQYAAAAFIMGLLPLIVKDITWPHRRIAYVPRPLHWVTEVFVRAMGVMPEVVKDSSHLPPYGRKFGRWAGRAIGALCFIMLCLTLSVLALVEVYSKRSSLHCPFPVFVFVWHLGLIIPAALEVLTSRGCDIPGLRWVKPTTRTEPKFEGEEYNSAPVRAPLSMYKIIQASGAEETWWIQVAWAIYYTAGSLFYASIMIVTVRELIVWTLTSFAIAAASKMLAYKLCGYWGSGWHDIHI